MAALSFSASVAQWADKVEGAVEAIFKEATHEVVEEMQKPIDSTPAAPMLSASCRRSWTHRAIA
ncbi:hypothetical protein [Sinorhizobium medicae]|uniref:hypothetical protein n=1 Tax=Sinorhizobium medicae TaxID=110321 RepID=UPI001F361052|nr:hypothetical protein [Sinorhizobium medicae]